MDTQTAQFILAVITTAATVVWLIGLRYLLGASRPVQAKEGRNEDEPEVVATTLARGLSGSAEVEGQAKGLADKASSLLAKQSWLSFGLTKVLEKSDSRITWEERSRWRAWWLPGWCAG